MTGKTQIEAGRELDALVAVEVMGWSSWRIDEMEEHWGRRGPGSSYESGYEPPRYSTTGDGMLAVLERMRELGWAVEIQAEDKHWWVDFYRPIEEKIGHATTLPHAVCLAALEAVRA